MALAVACLCYSVILIGTALLPRQERTSFKLPTSLKLSSVKKCRGIPVRRIQVVILDDPTNINVERVGYRTTIGEARMDMQWVARRLSSTFYYVRKNHRKEICGISMRLFIGCERLICAKQIHRDCFAEIGYLHPKTGHNYGLIRADDEGVFRWNNCNAGAFLGNHILILPSHQVGLALDSPKSQTGNNYIDYCDVYDDPFRSSPARQRFFAGCVLCVAGFFLSAWSGNRWVYNRARWWDCGPMISGLVLACMGATLMIFGHAWPPKQEPCNSYGNGQTLQHDRENVPRNVLTSRYFLEYI